MMALMMDKRSALESLRSQIKDVEANPGLMPACILSVEEAKVLVIALSPVPAERVARTLSNLDAMHITVTKGTGYDPQKYSSTYSEAAALIRDLTSG